MPEGCAAIQKGPQQAGELQPFCVIDSFIRRFCPTLDLRLCISCVEYKMMESEHLVKVGCYLTPFEGKIDFIEQYFFSSGSITTADGSALVKLGNTTVICGVKAVWLVFIFIYLLADFLHLRLELITLRVTITCQSHAISLSPELLPDLKVNI